MRWKQSTQSRLQFIDIEGGREKIVTHDLDSELGTLSQFESFAKLQQSTVYQNVINQIDAVTEDFEYGFYADPYQPQKPFLRAILWNLDHGQNFEGVLETLRNRAFLNRADIYMFPHVDIGRFRSGNRNIARDLAMELGYNYFFVTSFLHLKDSHHDDMGHGDLLGVSGNAILTRLPLSNLRFFSFDNHRDTLQGLHKKIGHEKALLADIEVGAKRITLGCLCFPRMSSKWQRRDWAKIFLHNIREWIPDTAFLLGGDLATSCYDVQNNWSFTLSILNKFYRGYDFILDEHHEFPEKHFERELFELFQKFGFSYQEFNELGQGDFRVPCEALSENRLASSQAGRWVHQLLLPHQERTVFKTDWFLGNFGVRPSISHQAERPKVVTHLFHDGRVVSRQDPVLLDFEVL